MHALKSILTLHACFLAANAVFMLLTAHNYDTAARMHVTIESLSLTLPSPPLGNGEADEDLFVHVPKIVYILTNAPPRACKEN